MVAWGKTAGARKGMLPLVPLYAASSPSAPVGFAQRRRGRGWGIVISPVSVVRDSLPEPAPLGPGDIAVEPPPARVEPCIGGIADRQRLLAGLPRRIDQVFWHIPFGHELVEIVGPARHEIAVAHAASSSSAGFPRQWVVFRAATTGLSS